MRNVRVCLICIIAIICFSAFNLAGKKDQQTYRTISVTGSTNNKIEILDFGGTGQPILFLTGLGNSAHVFVEFAPKFCDRFHVYAMTRRGFGASEQTANGYGIDTLSKDILAVTKALKFDKVILIGHSIAGDEISDFASSYPDKVSKIVYLDAAYDRRNFMSTLMRHSPVFPEPTTRDSASVGNLAAFVARTMGVKEPEEEIKGSAVFAKDGRYLKDVSPGEIQGLIISGLKRPDYKNIKCPALAIYAIQDSPYKMMPFYDSLDALNKRKADTCLSLFRTYSIEQRKVFRKEVSNATVKEIAGAHHYVFMSNPSETEKMIREFLH